MSRLYFGFTGDTRPSTCDAVLNYPTAIINSIYQKMGKLGVSFAVDLGDHMFICQGTQQNADTQMGYYMSAVQQLAPRPVFMTMGNHECATTKICGPASGYTPNQYKAYMNALAPISTTPWYSRDIQTDAGLAKFVFIADNAWRAEQASLSRRSPTPTPTRSTRSSCATTRSTTTTRRSTRPSRRRSRRTSARSCSRGTATCSRSTRAATRRGTRW